MVDMGQYDAMRTVAASDVEKDAVFARHRERMRLLRIEMEDEASGKTPTERIPPPA